MMLTVQQADIIALLTAFKYLRYSHIKKYLAARHGSADEHITKMVNQLTLLGKVRIDGDYVMLPGRKMDIGIVKAFDVVMDLTGGCAEFIAPGAQPFTLMFSVKAGAGRQEYNHFGVVIVEPYCENQICGFLSESDRNLTVIFVLSEKEQQQRIQTRNRSYFAVQEDHGKYQFFKAANQPQK
jgi:hypothetical protein